MNAAVRRLADQRQDWAHLPGCGLVRLGHELQRYFRQFLLTEKLSGRADPVVRAWFLTIAFLVRQANPTRPDPDRLLIVNPAGPFRPPLPVCTRSALQVDAKEPAADH